MNSINPLILIGKRFILKFNMIRYTVLLCWLLSSIGMNAQFIENEFLVRSSLNPADLSARLVHMMDSRSQVILTELSPDFQMFKIECLLSSSKEVETSLKKMPEIEFLSRNQFLNFRQSPNDVLFSEQWALGFSKIPKIWDVTTGGRTFDGKEIVIAVLDDGLHVNHGDIKDNIFINKKEIPNDGKDNDGNGYIDDYMGYNVDLNNGTPIATNHGTGVSGIIGAKGNNNMGVSGINWDVKILPIYGVNKLDEIIFAYSYVLKMKRLYLSSKGDKGAFVLVTNYSVGIAKAWGDVEPYKQWCAMYDLLGSEGILSVGATDNEPVNVDVLGDMPSTCSSEYFISTTNIDETGKKVFRAGFGTKFIAMGAPGENLVTLSKNDGFVKEFSGTSAASPMVAGTLALLFSTPCESFSNLINNDKAAAALAVRNAVLQSLTKTNDLKDQTKFGGYLNGEGALALMDEPCDGKLLLPSPKGEVQIKSVNSVNGELIIEYLTPDETDYQLIISNTLGQILFRSDLDVPSYGNKILNISQNLWPYGIYIVTIAGETGADSRLFFSK